MNLRIGFVFELAGLLILLLLSACSSMTGVKFEFRGRPPNVVFIMADDLG